MMKKLLLIFLFFLIKGALFAQQIDSDSGRVTVSYFTYLSYPSKTANGNVIIFQDPTIQEIVERHISINLENESKTDGWRIQIYNSNGNESKAEAIEIRKKFLAMYPHLEAYIVYQPPFFKIRVGNFRNREEAFFYFKQIVKDFPVSYLVRDKILYPSLQVMSKIEE